MHKPVMVVEDDMDIRTNFIAALKLEDYPVYSAVNGVEALRLLESLETSALPGCIIIDLMMPEMNGKEFIKRIKEHVNKDISSINLVVATAKGNSDTQEPLPYEVERLQKPLGLDDLYDVVERLNRD